MVVMMMMELPCSKLKHVCPHTHLRVFEEPEQSNRGSRKRHSQSRTLKLRQIADI